MVNVGGPSKGCLTCIGRKIKCDRQRPSCGQCLKSRRTCRGYRDTRDTMFRDQSQEVIAKINADSKSQHVESQMTSPSRPLKDFNGGASSPPDALATPAVPRSPGLDPERGWIEFFVINYTCPGTAGTKSNLFWIPPNFEDFLKDDVTRLTRQCVGAMAMARLRRSSACLREAQKKYSLALLTLADRWRQDVTNREKDTIFLAILLLSFFEVLAAYPSSSRQSWITHLGGLGVLFKNNEDYFAGTEFGARMFFQARSQVILVALQTKRPVADTFSRPNPRVRRSAPPAFQYFDDADRLLIRMANLQAQCRSTGPSRHLIDELNVLEKDCCKWETSLPQIWAFSKIEINRPSGMWWDVRCDVYQGSIFEHTWNKVRAARIMAYDLTREMLKHSSPLDTEDASAKATETSQDAQAMKIQELVTDICSTVPLYFRPPTASAEPYGVGNPPLLGTTYWLMWVLDVVGGMQEAPPKLTSWVIYCFERVHETTGNERAHQAANKLRMGQTSFHESQGYPDLLNMVK